MSAVLALATSTPNTNTETPPQGEPSVGAACRAAGPETDGAGETAARPVQRLDVNAFRRLSDLLLMPASMLHPQERAFAADLLHAALADADADIRGQLAARLARMGDIAPSLIARLARDGDIAVAAPLLRLSDAVADTDLIDILRSGCRERALIIAGRTVLSPDTVAEIAVLGDEGVLLTALENRGARFDPAMMAMLSKRVRDDAVLCEALLQRPEMSSCCALDLFWSVNRKLRMYVLTRFLQDGQSVRQILETSSNPPDVVRSGPVEVPAATDSHSGPGASTGTPESGTQGYLVAIAERMTQARGEDAARILAALTSVSVSTTVNIVADAGGEAIAVAFKAAGASRATFASACTLWRKADNAPLNDDRDVDVIGEQFDRLSRSQARMAMSYWNWRENKLGPYAPKSEITTSECA